MSVSKWKLFTLVFGVSASFSVSANDGQEIQRFNAIMENTVNGMLLIDANRAVVAEQKMLDEINARLGGPSATSLNQSDIQQQQKSESEAEPVPVVVPVQMDVVGIFGLGNNLLADVMINGAKVRFKRGHAAPLGMNSDYPYRLVGIEAPCVKITDATKTLRSVCLNKSGL